MNINTVFSSHLKADDIGNSKPVVTIDRVEVEKVGDEDKPVIYFVGKAKGLVCNRTNANMITELLGTAETDEWTGQRIRLYKAKVDFQGKRVDAIRIEGAPSVQAKPKPVVSEDADELTADEIRF